MKLNEDHYYTPEAEKAATIAKLKKDFYEISTECMGLVLASVNLWLLWRFVIEPIANTGIDLNLLELIIAVFAIRCLKFVFAISKW